MKFILRPLATAILITTLHFSTAALAQTEGAIAAAKLHLAQSGQVPSTGAINKMDPLAAGAELFENFTESSPVMDAAAFNKSLAKFEALYPSISARLSADGKKRLDFLVTEIRSAWRQGNRGAMALESIEAYRLLTESMDRSGQPVPLEVPLLDYTGFKLNALLLSKHPDWKEVGRTAQEASAWWAAIEANITDKSLREAMAHTIAGIKEASNRKDPSLLRFAAEMDLILVDGLETFFNSHTKVVDTRRGTSATETRAVVAPP